MVGITSYGAYIPIVRMSRDAIAQAWVRGSAGGERSVASFDEDSLTMATEACFDALTGIKREQIGGLFFASTTSPFSEKQSAAFIATVADLSPEIFTADYANSLRAGTTALRTAADMVKAGSADNILVAAADRRLGYPQSPEEDGFGDGAAALVIGSSGVIAEIECVYSVTNEIIDVWREDKATFVSTWEGRFVTTHGYVENMRKAVTGIMKKSGLSAQEITKVVLYAPDARSLQDVARAGGFDAKTQVQDPLLRSMGNTGAAHALMVLVSALEEAKPGDKILLAGYGDGADAFILRVTDEITKLGKRRGIKSHLASKMMIPSYQKYLLYRGIIPQPEELFNIGSAATMLWRDRPWVYRGHGSKCRNCGLTTYPIQRVCYGCQAKDDYDEVRVVDEKGKVFSFTLDNLAGGPQSPIPHTVVEFDESKARAYFMMTDFDSKEVKVGLPIEMTFRLIREARGYYNYFWKCRPLREGGN